MSHWNRTRRTILFIVLTGGSPVREAAAYSSGPPPDAAGNPPTYFDCTFCHSTYPLNSGSGTLSLLGLPAGYLPGGTSEITVLLAHPYDPGNPSVATRWGFELTALDAAGMKAGTISLPPDQTGVTQIQTANGREFVMHKEAGTYPGTTGSAQWRFLWTAPNESAGTVLFYVAGNAANNNGMNTGDYVYTVVRAIEAPVAVESPTWGRLKSRYR